MTSLRASCVMRTIERFSPYRTAAGVSRIADVTGLDRLGIPVFSATRPASRSVSMSMGKGRTPPLAFASALMESLELHVAENLPPTEESRATSAELAERGVDHQLDGLLKVGAEGVDTRRLDWLRSIDLVSGDVVLVPRGCVSVDYRGEFDSDLQSSTNGLASGNSIGEASVHALLEVIERDALALWQQSPADVRFGCRVDPRSIDCPVCRELVIRFERSDVLLRVLDLSTDLSVPVFMVVAIDAVAATPTCMRWVSGSGSHLCRRTALARALTEAAQVRLTLIIGSRDDVPCAAYEHSPPPEALHRALLTMPCTRRFDEVPSVGERFASARAELDALLERLARTAMAEKSSARVLRVILRDPQVPIPCVKVLVPGLENPIDEHGYRPGPRARALAR